MYILPKTGGGLSTSSTDFMIQSGMFTEVKTFKVKDVYIQKLFCIIKYRL